MISEKGSRPVRLESVESKIRLMNGKDCIKGYNVKGQECLVNCRNDSASCRGRKNARTVQSCCKNHKQSQIIKNSNNTKKVIDQKSNKDIPQVSITKVKLPKSEKATRNKSTMQYNVDGSSKSLRKVDGSVVDQKLYLQNGENDKAEIAGGSSNFQRSNQSMMREDGSVRYNHSEMKENNSKVKFDNWLEEMNGTE